MGTQQSSREVAWTTNICNGAPQTTDHHNLNLEEEDCKFRWEEVSRNGYSRLL